jgi:FKBP-type peptidyl-prolyl cis-trans isomerase
MKLKFFLLFLFVSFALFSQSNDLEIVELKEGTGRPAKKGSNIKVLYTGWLISGKKFDSNNDRQKPFEFKLGRGSVIKGWDRGIVGMREGGRRKLIIPSELAYGKMGSPPDIPPNSQLVFEVELIEVD